MGATLQCAAWASHCGGFSCCGARALLRRLRSCGAWASLLHGMWDLPGPGLEPVSPALAGGFLTTAPPGKPGIFPFNSSECSSTDHDNLGANSAVTSSHRCFKELRTNLLHMHS